MKTYNTAMDLIVDVELYEYSMENYEMSRLLTQISLYEQSIAAHQMLMESSELTIEQTAILTEAVQNAGLPLTLFVESGDTNESDSDESDDADDESTKERNKREKKEKKQAAKTTSMVKSKLGERVKNAFNLILSRLIKMIATFGTWVRKLLASIGVKNNDDKSGAVLLVGSIIQAINKDLDDDSKSPKIGNAIKTLASKLPEYVSTTNTNMTDKSVMSKERASQIAEKYSIDSETVSKAVKYLSIILNRGDVLECPYSFADMTKAFNKFNITTSKAYKALGKASIKGLSSATSEMKELASDIKSISNKKSELVTITRMTKECNTITELIPLAIKDIEELQSKTSDLDMSEQGISEFTAATQSVQVEISNLISGTMKDTQDIIGKFNNMISVLKGVNKSLNGTSDTKSSTND